MTKKQKIQKLLKETVRVNEIRRKYSYRDIAKRVGVSTPYVCQVAKTIKILDKPVKTC